MIQQVKPKRRWPGGEGWTVAITRSSPAELTRSLGLTFEAHVDDLDGFLVAAVESAETGQIWLFRHDHAPESGTEVIVDRSVSRNAATAALRRLLGLGPDEFTWLAPVECPPSLDPGSP